MKIKSGITFLIGVLCLQSALAADYILSAPPTEQESASKQLFEPIAGYLSEETGENIRFEYAGNWPSYSRNMQSARYDLLFDGPHFVSWRVEKIEHMPLARLPQDLLYVVFARSNDQAATDLDDLKGKTVCSSAMPNLDALTLLDQYGSPWNQPRIKPVQGFDAIFGELTAGGCAAAVLPQDVYADLAGKLPGATRVLFQSQPLPHFAFSASPRMSASLRESIQKALTRPDAPIAITTLVEYFRSPTSLVLADQDEFRGFGYLLEEFWASSHSDKPFSAVEPANQQLPGRWATGMPQYPHAVAPRQDTRPRGLE